MAENISGFGTSIFLTSTVTFPSGFKLTAFPDDVDPIEIEDYQAGDHDMLLDGSLFPYQMANPVKVVVRLIPGSDDDENMKIVMDAARIKQNFIQLPDYVSISVNYPDGSTLLLSQGYIRKGAIGNSVQATGRMRSNSYELVFGEQNRIGGSVFGTVVSVAGAISSFF